MLRWHSPRSLILRIWCVRWRIKAICLGSMGGREFIDGQQSNWKRKIAILIQETTKRGEDFKKNAPTECSTLIKTEEQFLFDDNDNLELGGPIKESVPSDPTMKNSVENGEHIERYHIKELTNDAASCCFDQYSSHKHQPKVQLVSRFLGHVPAFM